MGEVPARMFRPVVSQGTEVQEEQVEGLPQQMRDFKREFILWMLILRVAEVLIYVAVLFLFFRDLSRW